MKKLLLLLLFLLTLLVPTAQALINNNIVYTSCNAVTGATTCGNARVDKMSRYITWHTITTGSPAGVDADLEGSLDQTNWEVLDTSTSTTGEMRHVVNKGVNWLRVKLNTLSGGTAPTFTAKIAAEGG